MVGLSVQAGNTHHHVMSHSLWLQRIVTLAELLATKRKIWPALHGCHCEAQLMKD